MPALRHYGICRKITGGFFLCGSTYHLIVNCPQGSGSYRNPHGSSRGGSKVPPLSRDRGRGRGKSEKQGRGTASETVNRPTAIIPA